MVRWSRTRILSASLVAVLVLLAVQQWRWIREIEGHEHNNQDRRVGYAAWIFKTMFEHEVGDLIAWTGAPTEGPTGVRDLAQRVERWRTSSRWPGLVAAVYVVAPSSDGKLPSLAHLDVESGTTQPEVWPEQLESLARMLSDPSSLRGRDVPTNALVLPSIPAVVGLPPSRQGPMTLVLLDEGYLATRMIPELVQMAFPPTTFRALDVTVVEAADGRVVFSTAGTSDAATLGPVDAVYGLVREGANPADRDEISDLLSPGARGPRKGESAVIPGAVEDPGDDDEAWFRAHWSWVAFTGHWRVLAHLRDGPALVQAASGRNRQLLTAFGLLGILAAAVGVVVMTNRSAQREARRELERLAVVSHELRTPLSVLGSAGENLADGITSGEGQARQYGRLVLRETRRLEELVENVLHLARGRAKVPPPVAKRVRVGELIEDSLQASATGLDEARFTVEVSPPSRPLEVAGDARALRSALVNLISNAVRHARDGHWVRVSAEPARDREVRITVEDRGPGFDPRSLPRLVRPYVRGEGTGAEGSGLGLTVVQDVVKAHGGRLAARRRSGGGTEMTLILPLAGPP